MKGISVWLAPILLLAGAGCVTEGSSPAINGWIDLTPGTVIEIRTRRLDTPLGYYLPRTPEEGSERGARAGLSATAAAASVSPLGVLTAPVTLPLGAILGSAVGMSDAEAVRCAEAIRKESDKIDFTEDVTDELVRLGKQKTPLRWRLEGEANLTNQAHTVIVEVLPACFALSPPWEMRNSINPPLELVGEINCVIYTADQAEHYAIERFGYHSNARLFREWAGTPGLVTREIEHCNQQLARRILADLFEVKIKSSAERRGRSKGGF